MWSSRKYFFVCCVAFLVSCKVTPSSSAVGGDSALKAVHDSQGHILRLNQEYKGQPGQLAFEACYKGEESFEALEGSCTPAFRSSTGASLVFSRDELRNIMSEEERKHMDQVLRKHLIPSSDKTLVRMKNLSLGTALGMIFAGLVFGRSTLSVIAIIPGMFHLYYSKEILERGAKKKVHGDSYDDFLGMGVRWHAAISSGENKEVNSVAGFLRNVGFYLKENLESAKTLVEFCYPSSPQGSDPRCFHLG